MRLLGLVLTISLVLTTCYLSWEILARQCGEGACDGAPSWVDWLLKVDNDGVLLLTAAVLPAAVVALVWMFGRRPTRRLGESSRPRRTRSGTWATRGSGSAH